MSDSQIQPTPPVKRVGWVRPVQPQLDHAPTEHKNVSPEVTTGGNLRAAYAQFIIDADTQDVVVQIRDATTNQVLNELPSKEVQAMTKHLRDYAETLAKRRAALQNDSST
jgi:hypothetical protein